MLCGRGVTLFGAGRPLLSQFGSSDPGPDATSAAFRRGRLRGGRSWQDGCGRAVSEGSSSAAARVVAGARVASVSWMWWAFVSWYQLNSGARGRWRGSSMWRGGWFRSDVVVWPPV